VTPENPRGYNNLGGLYMYLGRWSEAREVFERTLSIGAWPASYSNLGTLYFLDSRFSDAAKMYEKALESDKNNYVLWGNLGNAYQHGGQADKAAAARRRAIELAEAERGRNPEDRYIVIDLAGYYGMLGEREKGLALLGQVLAAPIDDPDLMAEVGARFDDLGDRERALEWIARALQHGYSRSLLEVSPAFRELRADPRYAQVIAQGGSR
jgi:tetratricopeptide (TPR) repeat protein